MKGFLKELASNNSPSVNKTRKTVKQQHQEQLRIQSKQFKVDIELLNKFY